MRNVICVLHVDTLGFIWTVNFDSILTNFLKYFSKSQTLFARSFVTLSVFNGFAKFLRRFKDIAEHYILDENIYFLKWRRKWKNEDEKFRLLYYLFCMVKSRIVRFLIPWPLQICKWFRLNIIIFEQRLALFHMTCMKNCKKSPKNMFFSRKPCRENLIAVRK